MLEQTKAVTLIEILVVVIILGILAALALPNFGFMRERAVDREAAANVKLLQAAEKLYRMEIGVYWGADNTQDLNTELRLDLSARSWEYSATTTGGADLDARATRQSPPVGWDRQFYIDQDNEEACCCPNDPRCTPALQCEDCSWYP